MIQFNPGESISPALTKALGDIKTLRKFLIQNVLVIKTVEGLHLALNRVGGLFYAELSMTPASMRSVFVEIGETGHGKGAEFPCPEFYVRRFGEDVDARVIFGTCEFSVCNRNVQDVRDWLSGMQIRVAHEKMHEENGGNNDEDEGEQILLRSRILEGTRWEHRIGADVIPGHELERDLLKLPTPFGEHNMT